MHTSGHAGVGLLAAAPLVVVLDQVGLGAAAVPATGLLVGLSTLPDVDEYVPGTAHRGWTHSVPFGLAVGLAVAAGGWLVGPGVVDGTDPATLAVLGFAIGVLAVVLHLLADVVTPMGVSLLWPVSRERRSLGLVRSADERANRTLLAVGLVVWIAVLVGTAAG